MRIITTPRTGAFAGRVVYTDKEGLGIFTKLPNGNSIQHTGLLQTPKFTSSRQFAAWLRRNYPAM